MKSDEVCTICEMVSKVHTMRRIYDLQGEGAKGSILVSAAGTSTTTRQSVTTPKVVAHHTSHTDRLLEYSLRLSRPEECIAKTRRRVGEEGNPWPWDVNPGWSWGFCMSVGLRGLHSSCPAPRDSPWDARQVNATSLYAANQPVATLALN